MSKPLKKVFKTKVSVHEDGKQVDKELELAVRIPTAVEKQKARLVHAKSWRDAVESGAIMREALDRYLRDQKVWDDLRQRDYDKLRSNILNGERRLKMGGNAGLTKNQARDLALEVSDWRGELSELLTERNRVDANTADALADQSQFNYYVSTCTVYNDTGKPYFSVNGSDSNLENYIEKSTEKVGFDAASKFAEIWYGTDDEATEKLPEQKFLKEYGFADDKDRLVNKQGKLIDRKGRLVDDKGRFVNDKGEYVDSEGQRVDENGQYIVDFSPFLKDEDDEEEKPSLPALPEPEPEKEKPKVEVVDKPKVEEKEKEPTK